MVMLKINDKKVEAQAGAKVLQAARSVGIEIPTLCSNDALEPYGACRLCVVEIEKNGKTVVESACTAKAEEGLVVKTDSPLIVERRKVVVGLLLARCPGVEVIQELADKLGVDRNVTPTKDNEECILCGLCVRACNEVVGAKAIQFAGRGLDRVVTSPLEKTAENCVACGSCVYICPTGAVKKLDLEVAAMRGATAEKDAGPTREISNWKVALELQACTKCGNPYAPVFHLSSIKKQFYMLPDTTNLCPTCREYPKIDVEKCLGGGSCAESCPIGALELDDRGGYDKKSRVYEQNCMACHTCESKCPVQAIS